MKKIAFITGATSGIGKACAETFAEQGYNLILCGRRLDRLSQLKEELISKFSIQILCSSFDVQYQSEVTNAILSIPDEWKNIDVLINNAGLSLGRDNFSDASIQDWETMMQTNVMGVIYVTKALMDSIVQHQTHIINIGSIAAKEVYENGNGYCASKAALDSLSKSMRIDLLPKGVKVTAIHPGAVET